MTKAKARRLTLTQALEQVADRPVAVKPAPPEPKQAAQPGRQGTKTVAGHFAATVSKQLKQLALDLDSNVQELLREAINDLFVKHGKPPVA